MQDIAYRVLPYSSDALAAELTTKRVTEAEIRAKDHFAYLSEYLGSTNDALGAQTMLVEEPYVSQSYLTDYASYYSLGFADYPRFCKRIHFFKLAFAQSALEDALVAPDAPPLTEQGQEIDPAALARWKAAQDLWGSYLGYVVVKPLPTAPIGATLLKPYDNGAEKVRHYPARRPYHLNLLGKPLTLNSLIFQEQDLVVSACATTALWMAFHKTAQLFQTVLPSPYQITAATKNLFNSTGRTFPNDGLDLYQIGNAIESVGLVAELLFFDTLSEIQESKRVAIDRQRAAGLFPYEGFEGLTQEDIADLTEEERDEYVEQEVADQTEMAGFEQMRRYKRIIYAYLRLGLPILLFVRGDGADSEHLVTVTGYREAPQTVRRTPAISLVGEQVERLYIHDDQLGPFARLGFTEDGQLNTVCAMPGSEGPNDQTAALLNIFVPLASEIRINFEQVYILVEPFDVFLYPRLNNPEDVVWDLYLSTSNHYKDELRQNPYLPAAERIAIGKRLLPKYVWVARAYLGTTPILELLFDATDLHTGFFCLGMTWFSQDLKHRLTSWLSDPFNRQETVEATRIQWRYLDMLFAELGLPLTNNASTN
ncbi:hypothetical protein HNQ93_004049 [Hymenobacter luteus]|uniref:Uncharacterized protein n=2 Tax=Hymenobacter TaxID=89966 RepID=A0A7W9T590_9BACT|nr:MULTISPECIES: hypothetical protein [Hymenobacter]MBB4603476.1 hypothetical protein [Hymenobacter latericoloratus]MBB6061170.1 hypothetical protein [Hymenobacter luteus]